MKMGTVAGVVSVFPAASVARALSSYMPSVRAMVDSTAMPGSDELEFSKAPQSVHVETHEMQSEVYDAVLSLDSVHCRRLDVCCVMD